MNTHAKKWIKRWLPPAMVDLINRHRCSRWRGDYRTWDAAAANASTYSEDHILKRVIRAQEMVVSGEMAFERDGIAFRKPQYSWPLLGALLWVAAKTHGKLDIVDFGGSLGSTYHQHRRFLDHLTTVNWRVVEQPHIVAAGQKAFQNDRLTFHQDIDSCFEGSSPDTILFSSAIQYLQHPYEMLSLVKSRQFQNIIFDRTGFVLSGGDRLTVQTVPPSIYPATYPCWFFERRRFLAALRDDYELMTEFDALGGEIRIDNRIAAVEKGLILARKAKAPKP